MGKDGQYTSSEGPNAEQVRKKVTYLVVLMQLGTDVLDVAPADATKKNDEEDPVQVHSEDGADVVVAVNARQKNQNICHRSCVK
jgi:formylmethanofuran dehydrogenase subunit D